MKHYCSSSLTCKRLRVSQLTARTLYINLPPDESFLLDTHTTQCKQVTTQINAQVSIMKKNVTSIKVNHSPYGEYTIYGLIQS